jgi:hypothetical protein
MSVCITFNCEKYKNCSRAQGTGDAVSYGTYGTVEINSKEMKEDRWCCKENGYKLYEEKKQ